MQLLQFIRPVYPWQRTLYITFIAQLITAIGFSSIFPFLPLYVQALGTHTSLSVEFLAGLVFSAQAFTMALTSPVWGALADRYGRKMMVERALFGGTVVTLLMGFVRTAEELVLLRAIQGLITGTVAANAALVAAAAPRERTGYAMGLLQVGLWAGVAVGPLIGGSLADAFGYRMAFVVTALLLALAGVLVWLGIEEKFEPSPESRQRGLSGLFSGWRLIVSAPGVGLTYGLEFLTGLGRIMLVPIMPLFMQLLLSDSSKLNTITGLVISVAAAMSTATAVYLGRLGDRIGHRRILLASALAAGLLYLPQSLVTQAWQLLILQGLTGAATGGIIPAIGALLAQYTHPGEEGRVYGLHNSLRAGSRAVAPLVGASIAFWFGFRGTFAATGLLFLAVTLLAVFWLPETAHQVD